MSTERSDRVFEAAREARQKFDYFILGLIGAVCAFIAQSFRPEKLGFNPSTVELVSLVLLVASAIYGFKRIDSSTTLMHVNAKLLRMNEEKGMLIKQRGKVTFNSATGEHYSASVIEEKISALDSNIPATRQRLDTLQNVVQSNYEWRNRLLLAGFIALLGARVFSAYV